jgi:hypothetical protein
MKIADVVRRWPETRDVFSRKGCQDIGSGMARIMTVRNAARMEGIDLAPLLDELNRVAARSSPHEA